MVFDASAGQVPLELLLVPPLTSALMNRVFWTSTSTATDGSTLDSASTASTP